MYLYALILARGNGMYIRVVIQVPQFVILLVHKSSKLLVDIFGNST